MTSKSLLLIFFIFYRYDYLFQVAMIDEHKTTTQLVSYYSQPDCAPFWRSRGIRRMYVGVESGDLVTHYRTLGEHFEPGKH